MMVRRNGRGQSLVEYAIGLGCVAGLSMVVLGNLGHICGDIIYAVHKAIKYDNYSAEPGRLMEPGATPWVLP